MSEHTEKEVTNNRFYQMPKFLFNEKYIKLSNDSKVLYTLLRDRYDLSLKNDWIDKEGNIFLKYSQEKMSVMLGRTVKTIRKSMKELSDYELIKEERQGLNRPNLIYVLQEGIDTKVPEVQQTIGQVNDTYQEGYKVPPSDTDFSKTEKNYIHLQSVEDGFISFYLKTFKRYLGKEHMRVKADDLYKINDVIDELRMYDVDIEQWHEEVTGHFVNLPKTNNGNILAFLKATKRYFGVDNGEDIISPTKFNEKTIEYELSEMLYNNILVNDENYKKPNLYKWAEHIDKLIRLDNRSVEDIKRIINFTTNDEFWQTNVLSTSKLRKQFSTLYQKERQASKNKPKGPSWGKVDAS